MKVIIIEGPDCSGKSTLIKQLTKDKRFRRSMLLKNNYRPTNEKDIYHIQNIYNEILNIINNYSEYDYIILDRYYPSEIVYSVLRGYESFDDKFYSKLDMIVSETDCLYVQFDHDFGLLAERLAKRGDEHIKSLNILQLITERYKTFVEKFTAHKHILKINNEDNKENINMIFDMVNKIGIRK